MVASITARLPSSSTFSHAIVKRAAGHQVTTWASPHQRISSAGSVRAVQTRSGPGA